MSGIFTVSTGQTSLGSDDDNVMIGVYPGATDVKILGYVMSFTFQAGDEFSVRVRLGNTIGTFPTPLDIVAANLTDTPDFDATSGVGPTLENTFEDFFVPAPSTLLRYDYPEDSQYTVASGDNFLFVVTSPNTITATLTLIVSEA